MGTDIHLYLEKKSKKTGKWEIVKGKNPDIEMYREWAEREKDLERKKRYLSLANGIEDGSLKKSKLEELEKEYPKSEREISCSLQEEYEGDVQYINDVYSTLINDWLYSGRNYKLFSILADVRNGYGFAGVPTGEGFIPISKPKGVPSDASNEYKEKAEQWDCDGHSFSYLTLKELSDYDWNQKTVVYGTVPEDYYKELRRVGKEPEMYSGGVSGRNIKTVTETEMDLILEHEELREKDIEYYVQMKWSVSYREAAGAFYPGSDEFNNMKELSEDENLEDVRIVFFFDN